MRRGVQLWELAVAGTVFVLSTLPVITLFTREGQVRRQGPDHALALGLAWRVSEEIAAAAVDNPRAPAELAREPVAAAGWPAGEAPAALWRELTGFTGRLAARPREELTDFSLTLEWSAAGDERELTLAFALPAERAAPDQAPAGADESVRARLYPAETGSLSEVVARRRADLATIRALGELAERVAGLDAPVAAAVGSEPRAGFLRAVAHEERAARRMVAMVRLAGRLTALAEVQAGGLGSPPPACRTQVSRLDELPRELGSALAGALEEFKRVAVARAVPPRVRSGAVRRAVEAGTLLALTSEPRALAAVQDLLDRAAVGREPTDRAAWARQEKATAATLSALKASYGAPARLDALSTYDRVMVRVRNRLLTLL